MPENLNDIVNRKTRTNAPLKERKFSPPRPRNAPFPARHSAATPEPASAVSSAEPDSGNRREDWRQNLPRGGWTRRQLAAGGLVAALVVVVFFLFASRAPVPSSAALPEAKTELPPELASSLDAALEKLKQGDTGAALRDFQHLERTHESFPSLSYLTALAALQYGDTELSAQKAAESLRKRERVADTLALQAVLETLKTGQVALADPRARAEALLREAMAADVANPLPMIGLARLARSQGRSEEAVKLLQGARSRMNPADNSAAVDISIELIRLQSLTDGQLPENPPASGDAVDVFADAYVAMRRGDFARSAQLLRYSREQLPGDVFDYLLHDPAIRRFSDEPRLAEFFQAPQPR